MTEKSDIDVPQFVIEGLRREAQLANIAEARRLMVRAADLLEAQLAGDEQLGHYRRTVAGLLGVRAPEGPPSSADAGLLERLRSHVRVFEVAADELDVAANCRLRERQDQRGSSTSSSPVP